MASGLALVIMSSAAAIGFIVVMVVAELIMGGPAFVRAAWRGDGRAGGYDVDIGILVGIPLGTALGLWVWRLVVIKSGLLGAEDEQRMTTSPRYVSFSESSLGRALSRLCRRR